MSRSRDTWRKAQETIKATDSRRRQRARRRSALKALRGLTFVAEAPFRVEALTGGEIGYGERAGWITDFHVVDNRGRTVKRLPHPASKTHTGLSRRRMTAEWYAAELNAL